MVYSTYFSDQQLNLGELNGDLERG